MNTKKKLTKKLEFTTSPSSSKTKCSPVKSKEQHSVETNEQFTSTDATPPKRRVIDSAPTTPVKTTPKSPMFPTTPTSPQGGAQIGKLL